MTKTDIIIHDEKDNVGVVVIEKITPKQDCSCWIMENDKTVNVQSLKRNTTRVTKLLWLILMKVIRF